MNQENIPVAEPVAQEPRPSAQGPSGRAIATLILGILSLICMGFVAGVPAIILGSMEMRAIKAGQAPAAGEATAKIGWILGIVGTVLTCLAALAFVALMALGLSLGAFSQITQSV